jgi:HAMP domain-containing protein
MIVARLKLYALVAAILAACVAVVLAAWRWHLIDIERTRAAAAAAQDFRATIERIENADLGKGDADDDLRWLDDRLRKASPQR